MSPESAGLNAVNSGLYTCIGNRRRYETRAQKLALLGGLNSVHHGEYRNHGKWCAKQNSPPFPVVCVTSTASKSYLSSLGWRCAPPVLKSTITGGHSKYPQDLRYTQKPIYFFIFTNNPWSYLLGSPVIISTMFLDFLGVRMWVYVCTYFEATYRYLVLCHQSGTEDDDVSPTNERK